MSEITQVLDFWFGKCAADGALDRAKRKMWFSSEHQYDAVIRKQFGKLHRRAARGELDAEWAATPRGRIALIVVLDQFSRHIHRGTATAFAQDPAAQRLAAAGVEQGSGPRVDSRAARVLLPAVRALPRTSSCSGSARAAFERLAPEVAPAWRKEYDGFADYAGHHRDIVERFGRFPHRNRILGRASTPEEIEFLKEPGSSF